MNYTGIVVSDGIGNQLFKIFATLSYYIDNSQNYVLYTLPINGYRKYYWDTLFNNISQKVSYRTSIPEKYTEPFFHYKKLPIFNNDTVLEGYFQSHKYFEHDSHGYFSRLNLTQNYSVVTAACLVIKRSTYEKVGGLDEVNLKVAFNDVDFCMKVREAGYRNLWTPYAELYHHESVSRGAEDTPEKQARANAEVDFIKSKWGSLLTEDPYYSPHLTKDREDFSIN
jgi:GT2 family glycosyltransferase